MFNKIIFFIYCVKIIDGSVEEIKTEIKLESGKKIDSKKVFKLIKDGF